MAKNVKPQLPRSTPPGPIERPFRAPKPLSIPGKPEVKGDPGSALGAVDGAGAPQDFSSRQPGGTFTPRPV